MNTFVVCCFMAVVVGVSVLATTDQIDETQQYFEECVTESGAPPELVYQAISGGTIDDPKVKEHLFCFSKKLGFQTCEGRVQRDVMKVKLFKLVGIEEAVDLMVDKCAIQKDLPEDTALETTKCFMEIINKSFADKRTFLSAS